MNKELELAQSIAEQKLSELSLMTHKLFLIVSQEQKFLEDLEFQMFVLKYDRNNLKKTIDERVAAVKEILSTI